MPSPNKWLELTDEIYRLKQAAELEMGELVKVYGTVSDDVLGHYEAFYRGETEYLAPIKDPTSVVNRIWGIEVQLQFVPRRLLPVATDWLLCPQYKEVTYEMSAEAALRKKAELLAASIGKDNRGEPLYIHNLPVSLPPMRYMGVPGPLIWPKLPESEISQEDIDRIKEAFHNHIGNPVRIAGLEVKPLSQEFIARFTKDIQEGIDKENNGTLPE